MRDASRQVSGMWAGVESREAMLQGGSCVLGVS